MFRRSYQSILNDQLVQAVSQCKIHRVNLLLERGASVKTLDDNDKSLLALAALCAEKQSSEEPVPPAKLKKVRALINLLLHWGADVNQRNPRGETPLMTVAVVKNHLALKLLIDASADLCAQDNQGFDVMSHLRLHGLEGDLEGEDISLVKRLLRKGANPNIQDHHGKTFLMFVAAKGCLPTVKMLLSAGADPHLRDAQGRTAADFALHADRFDVEDVLRRAMTRKAPSQQNSRVA